MPLPTVHFALARVPLEHWAARPGLAPFDVGERVVRNAYLNGALGPDMGFFPGGERLLSELAHGPGAGDLTRALAASARRDVDRAFAWGWLTHALADASMHPAVNAEAARRLVASGRDVERGITFEAEHIRVEVGLDAYMYARHAWARAVRLHTCLDREGVERVAGVYREVFGLSIRAKWVRRSHHVVAPFAVALSSLLQAHATSRRPHLAGRTLRGGLRRLVTGARPYLAPTSLAFLAPFRPRPELLSELRATLARFWHMVRRCQVEGLDALGHPDLDAGSPALSRSPSDTTFPLSA